MQFRCPAGGRTFFVACLPCLLLSFLPPIPPTPFPGGEGGDSRLFHARGSAPCIPGTEPARHWERGRTTHPAWGLPPALPVDLAAVVSAGGLIFLVACLPCLLLSFFPPIPPPSPAGKGEIQGYFMQGASPLASPGLNPRGTGKGTNHAPGGGLPPALPVDPAAVVLAWAACLLGRLPTLPLVLILPPIPPTPFPGGEGGDSKIILPGASPPAPRHLTVCGIYRPCHTGAGRRWDEASPAPGGACPRRCRLTLPLWYSQGGLSFWSPACPAFCFPFCPLSPQPPSPAGKGDQGYFMQRASPLASPGLNPGGAGKGGRTTHPAGLAPALPLDLAAVVLAGGLIFLVACRPCLLLSFLPPFPGGEG